jgi:hypothetical protein
MVPYLSLYPSFSTMKPLLCLSKKFIESRTIPVLFSLQGGYWFRPARNWQMCPQFLIRHIFYEIASFMPAMTLLFVIAGSPVWWTMKPSHCFAVLT